MRTRDERIALTNRAKRRKALLAKVRRHRGCHGYCPYCEGNRTKTPPGRKSRFEEDW